MLVLLRDYFSINRKRVLRDVLGMYGAGMLFSVAILGQAAIHDAFWRVMPGPIFAVFLSLIPAILVFTAHVVAATIVGIRLSRAAGLSVGEYVKSDLYEEYGKATPRVFLG